MGRLFGCSPGEEAADTFSARRPPPSSVCRCGSVFGVPPASTPTLYLPGATDEAQLRKPDD